MNNLFIAITVGDNDGTIALPYTEANVEMLSNAISLKRQCSWRGIPTFEYDTKNIHISLIKESDITTKPESNTEES